MKKRAAIRVIDQGGPYDITGNLRRIDRAIQRGDYGRVTNMVVAFSDSEGAVYTYNLGPGDVSMHHWIVSVAKNKMERA